MKNLSRTLMMMLILSSAVFAQDEPEPSLSEADRLISKAGQMYQLGRYDEAIALAKRSLEIREMLTRADDPSLITNLNYLGRLYQAKGEYGDAEKMYLRVLKIQEDRSGATPFDVARALKQAACAAQRNKQGDGAKELNARADKIIFADVPNITPATPITRGKALSKPAAAYPEEARRLGITGEVVVQIIIDETGEVIFACALKGHPMLSAAAEQAALRARYSPTLVAGKPVKVVGTTSHKFER